MLMALQDSKDKNKAELQFLFKQMVQFYSLELNDKVMSWYSQLYCYLEGFVHSIKQGVPHSNGALTPGHWDGENQQQELVLG